MNRCTVIFFVMASFLLCYALLSDWAYTNIEAFKVLRERLGDDYYRRLFLRLALRIGRALCCVQYVFHSIIMYNINYPLSLIGHIGKHKGFKPTLEKFTAVFFSNFISHKSNTLRPRGRCFKYGFIKSFIGHNYIFCKFIGFYNRRVKCIPVTATLCLFTHIVTNTFLVGRLS